MYRSSSFKVRTQSLMVLQKVKLLNAYLKPVSFCSLLAAVNIKSTGNQIGVIVLQKQLIIFGVDQNHFVNNALSKLFDHELECNWLTEH